MSVIRRSVLPCSVLLSLGCYDPTQAHGRAQHDDDSTTNAPVEHESSNTGALDVEGSSSSMAESTGIATTHVASSEESGTTGTPVHCSAPVLLGSFPTVTQTGGIAVFGSRAYAVETNTGLHILDLTDPSNPGQLGSLALPNPYGGLVARGTMIYVADPTGLYVVDAAEADQPEPAGLIPAVDGHSISGIAVDAEFIYYLDQDSPDACPSCGLHIADVDDLQTVGELLLGSEPRDLVVQDDIAYVANGNEGLTIVDVSDRAAPIELATLDLDAYVAAIAVQDGRAYLAAAGLQIVDVGDPSAPAWLGTSTPSEEISLGIAVVGDRAYLGDARPGLRVFDVAEPTAMIEIAVLDTFEYGSDVYADENKVVMTSWDGGVRVIAPPECE